MRTTPPLLDHLHRVAGRAGERDLAVHFSGQPVDVDELALLRRAEPATDIREVVLRAGHSDPEHHGGGTEHADDTDRDMAGQPITTEEPTLPVHRYLHLRVAHRPIDDARVTLICPSDSNVVSVQLVTHFSDQRRSVTEMGLQHFSLLSRGAVPVQRSPTLLRHRFRRTPPGVRFRVECHFSLCPATRPKPPRPLPVERQEVSPNEAHGHDRTDC
jgi:hypothetical protein